MEVVPVKLITLQNLLYQLVAVFRKGVLSKKVVVAATTHMFHAPTSLTTWPIPLSTFTGSSSPDHNLMKRTPITPPFAAISLIISSVLFVAHEFGCYA
ncbi:hypothetical protein QQ054_32930, partial [Oscillatoria amoena NRMC-F 0135]|nr:hypothetical protein [Oscillatoria amoena NRMC-F 0135]